MKAWFRSLTRFERIFLVACCVLAPAEVIFKAVCHATAYGDFNVHRDFGARFLAGTPLYDGDLCFNYMPISALYYAPLAVFPPFLASILRTTAALACLFFTFRWLGAMVRDRARPGAFREVTFAAMAILLTIQYIFRDLDDGGPHLIYLGMVVGGMVWVRQGREGLAALGFGLVIAIKMSPGLMLPYFAWKRQWRLAGLTAVSTAAWIVLPAIWMGPSSWWEHQGRWNRLAFNIASDGHDAVNEANGLRVQNQALRPAVARFLVAYPPGHPLKLDHPADRDFLDLKPATANRVATLAILGVLGAVAWWSRRPYAGPGDPAWPVEMAAVMILIPLLSPVTWLQHLVFLIPAAYLIVAENRAFRRPGRAEIAALWLYATLAIVLSRAVLGRDNSLVLLGYHTHTLAMLLLLGVLMARRPTALASAAATDIARPLGLRVPRVATVESPASGR